MAASSRTSLINVPAAVVSYRGVARNQLGLSLRVAAMNLRRLVNLGLDHNDNWVLTNEAGPRGYVTEGRLHGSKPPA